MVMGEGLRIGIWEVVWLLGVVGEERDRGGYEGYEVGWIDRSVPCIP